MNERGERRTGRTYRAVEQAVAQARQGKRVLYVVPNHRMQKYVLDMIKQHFSEGLRDVRVWTALYEGSVRVHAVDGLEKLRGSRLDAVIDDHTVTENGMRSADVLRPPSEADLFARQFQHRVRSSRGLS